jgi:hypothetical protein
MQSEMNAETFEYHFLILLSICFLQTMQKEVSPVIQSGFIEWKFQMTFLHFSILLSSDLDPRTDSNLI